MPDRFTYDVFLSHNSQDKPRVRVLAEKLRAAGLRVWLDEWVIKPGDDIYLAIERGLEVARAQVLCLSPAALGSEWVTLERSTVLFRDPTNAGRRFIPLLLADCELPDALRRYKYVDYRRETKSVFAELLAACQSETELAPRPPSVLNNVEESSGPKRKSSPNPEESPVDLETQRKEYLRSVFQANQYIDPRGIRQVVQPVFLQLDEVYVSLQAEREHGWPKKAGQDEADRRIVELPTIIEQRLRLVILGDPGAGKTTLLRFLARLFASAEQQSKDAVVDKDGQDYGSSALPVLVRLAEYADFLHDAKAARLREFLTQSFGDTPEKRARFGSIIETALRAGKTIVLLDGLDEVLDVGMRVRIAHEIEIFTTNLEPDNRVVVTSRIVGYSEARLGAEFGNSVFTLCNMKPHHIERFLERWCLAVTRSNKPDAEISSIESEARSEARELILYINTSDGVQRLSVNPLLLTILALIRRASPSAPSHRVHLYQLASETLLHTWRIPQEPYSRSAILKRGQEELLLKPLAYEMHETEVTGLISYTRAKEFLQRTWARACGEEPDNPSPKIFDDIDIFMHCVNQHSGIFVERGVRKYGFSHLAFEEYFAGCEMVRLTREAVSRIHAHRHHPRWEEPIRLAIASYSNDHPEDAADLVRTAILGESETKIHPPSFLEPILHRDLFFAARCIGDCINPDVPLAKEVAQKLVAIYVDYKGLGRPSPVRQRVEVALRALKNTEGAEEAIRLFVHHYNSSTRSEEAVRRRVVEGVGRLGRATPQVHEFLINALSDPSRNVRWNATYAFASLGKATPEVERKLEERLEDESFFVRAGAADALIRLGLSPAAAEQEATSALLGEESEGWESAAEALVRLGQVKPEIVAKLLFAVKSEPERIRGRAKRALAIIGHSSPGALASMSDAVHDALKLSELAQDRLGAADTLTLLGQSSPEVEAVLLEALKSESASRRAQAARTLGIAGRGDQEITDALCAALGDPSQAVRMQSSEALGRLAQQKPKIVESLLAVLQEDPDPMVKGHAASALASLRISSREVLNALTNTLENSFAYAWMSAAIALVDLGKTDARVIKRLQQFQALESHRFLRDAAWEALWNAVQIIDNRHSSPSTKV
jgi:HEAT repeat protein